MATCPNSNINDSLFVILPNLNLNAQLVTLSACETGLGSMKKGEGIIGLTRALLYAGAKNMLVSLWTVSNASTALFMQTFYENLLSKSSKNIAQAMQQAKISLLNNTSYSMPYYWAAFVHIGE